MSSDDFWSSVYNGATEKKKSGRLSVMRIALLFGMIAVALALVIPPMVDESSGSWQVTGGNLGIDFTTTATIRRNREYTVRRSILQAEPDSVCIIDSAGRSSGQCR